MAATSDVKTSVFATTGDAAASWSNGIDSVDLSRGGQYGLLPMIGGIDEDKKIHEWMYNQSYQRRDLIAVVLQTPKFIEYLPNPEMWRAAIKALFEVHAKTIDGLDSSLTVATGDRDSGLSGAKFKEPTDVTRAETNVSISLEEKYGVPFELLLDTWIRYGIMDPDTKAPLITTLDGADDIKVYSPDYWSVTVMFIEPDVLLRKATHGWLTSNLFPESNPDIIGKKDKMSGREMKNITINFGGFSLPSTNRRVMELANTMLTSLSLYTRTPDEILLPTDKVAANLAPAS